MLGKHELSYMRRICLLVTTIYPTFWFASHLATDAPKNDLLMLELLEYFRQVNSKLAGAAEKKLRLQVWYLSKDLVPLSLFSDGIYDDNKQHIVDVIQRAPTQEDVRSLPPNKIPQFGKLSLENFATRRSLNLFESLHLIQDFFFTNVGCSSSTWPKREDYVAAQRIVNALKLSLTVQNVQ